MDLQQPGISAGEGGRWWDCASEKRFFGCFSVALYPSWARATTRQSALGAFRQAHLFARLALSTFYVNLRDSERLFTREPAKSHENITDHIAKRHLYGLQTQPSMYVAPQWHHPHQYPR